MAVTRLGADGYGVRRSGSFSGKNSFTYALTCAAGAFVLSGAENLNDYGIEPETGAFTLTGVAATPEYSPGVHPVGRITRLGADGYGVKRAGSFLSKTGGGVFVLLASPGAFTFSAQGSLSDREVTADAGSFTLTGNAATLTAVGTPYYPSISLTLTDAQNRAMPNLTGLYWAWWDSMTLAFQAAPIQYGSGATTNSSGVFSVTQLTSSALSPGDYGWFSVRNTAGTYIAAGPLVVS